MEIIVIGAVGVGIYFIYNRVNTLAKPFEKVQEVVEDAIQGATKAVEEAKTYVDHEVVPALKEKVDDTKEMIDEQIIPAVVTAVEENKKHAEEDRKVVEQSLQLFGSEVAKIDDGVTVQHMEEFKMDVAVGKSRIDVASVDVVTAVLTGSKEDVAESTKTLAKTTGESIKTEATSASKTIASGAQTAQKVAVKGAQTAQTTVVKGAKSTADSIKKTFTPYVPAKKKAPATKPWYAIL